MRKIVFTEPPVLDICYQDEYIVVINKPSGLLVHRSEIDKHETMFAIQLTRDQIGKKVFPIHRLDRPTSGVLVFALSSEIAKDLSQQLREKDIQKVYQAVVRGYCPEALTIDTPLKVMVDDKRLRNVAPAELQDAKTELKRLATSELDVPSSRYPTSRYSLVELSPITGRKHQLRRHMAHIRHPIIGDTTHGDNKQNKSALSHLGLDRLALFAQSISFTHPITKQRLIVSAKLDDSLTNLYQAMGWDKWLN